VPITKPGSKLKQTAQARQIAANDDARCQRYGAKPGSDAYVSCRMNIDNQRNANAHAADPRVMHNICSRTARAGARI
jgi:hypothetical protein